MNISALNLDFKELNEQVRSFSGDVCIRDCCGQRFIGSGRKADTLTIYGTPGNALGVYLDGGDIEVHGNVQDAVGDTMNGGKIIVHGNAGDALGYAMRGGSIFVQGDAGYRTGIHMKQYKEKRPTIVVGGKTGSFLGEYLAGGLIIVLGLGYTELPVGAFTGTGMHGGHIFIRTQREPTGLPAQVSAEAASPDDLQEIVPFVEAFIRHFGGDAEALLKDRYFLLTPNAKSPYKRLYTPN